MKLKYLLSIIYFIFSYQDVNGQMHQTGKLKISENKRYFVIEKGDPFFWLGDTGWLLFSKLSREEAEKYLQDRYSKGFNVIQVMVLHNLKLANAYGDSALINEDISMPKITPGNSFSVPEQYDYWDHVDFVINMAAEKGIYIAMVPVWGSNIKSGHVNREQARQYSVFLAERYKVKNNIIWLNGGDLKGSDSLQIWNTIGNTLDANDPGHLITYHPRGRGQSSTWFHNEPWLDFNMIQSGHRRYDQDTSVNDPHYGEDNWKYINKDYNLKPVKPTLDGEPSYEMIPQGLHDTMQPRWTNSDLRRYAYWSVFAGGAGFTYGHNSVMQFFKQGDKESSYSPTEFWDKAMNAPGAQEMIHLKNLMLSRPYFERIPNQSLVIEQREKYNYIAATSGTNYAFIYTYTGRTFKVKMGGIKGKQIKASWFNPRDGKITIIGTYKNEGIAEFNPPEEQRDGNDWVLLLDGGE